MATYSTGYATQNIADDATFRIRGKWFSDRLTDLGWAMTADTGQINWTTVTKPAGANGSAGYEIRTSNDGKTTIYIKIEYGTGSSATIFGFWITSGTGSTGAGALSGTVSERAAATGGAMGANACTDYIGGTTGRLFLIYGVTATLNREQAIIILQRTTDASLADDSLGWIQIVNNQTAATRHNHVSFSGGATVARTGWGASLGAVGPIPGSGSAIPVFPLYVFTPSQYHLVRDLILVPTAYAPMASVHTFALGGSNRTWIGLWGNNVASGAETNMPVAMTACFRWE